MAQRLLIGLWLTMLSPELLLGFRGLLMIYLRGLKTDWCASDLEVSALVLSIIAVLNPHQVLALIIYHHLVILKFVIFGYVQAAAVRRCPH